ncbi:MAG: helix-turn-helix transcriptional regulator [Pseudomonadota bacterium]
MVLTAAGIKMSGMNKKAYSYVTQLQKSLNYSFDPLKYLNINVFFYIKIFNNGKYILLSNHSAWQKHHYLHVHNQGKFFETCNKLSLKNQLKYFMWPSDPVDELLLDLYKHNIWNGISFCIRLEDSIERFCFASTNKNWQIKSCYLNNIDLLKRFLVFFREKSSFSLQNLDNQYCGIFRDGVDIMQIEQEANKIDVYDQVLHNEAITIPKYSISNTISGAKLSPRETECLYYISQGYLMREIAASLGISVSAVEYYLNNIKNKTACNTHAGLLSLSRLNS